MELLFNPSDIISPEKLKTWNKKALMEYILYCTYIKFPEESYFEDIDELPMDKLIARI